MPYIQINDVYGVGYMIKSSDNETVARWLIETLTKLATPDLARNAIRIQVEPLWIGDHLDGAWDWHPRANQSLIAELRELTPIGNIRALISLVNKYADEVEKA